MIEDLKRDLYTQAHVYFLQKQNKITSSTNFFIGGQPISIQQW